MIGSLRHFLRSREIPARPSVPPGQRVYAIGDIHGRLDLLAALATAIAADNALRDEHASADTTIVLLGDLIDRGPDSAGVLAFARSWQNRARPHIRVRILMGNHEEMLLASFDDTEALCSLLRYGGRATLASFGIETSSDDSVPPEAMQAALREAVPVDMLAFLRSFEDMVRIGDYAFVHAGILPGRPLEAQKSCDTRWIREPFLSSRADHGAVVVHGHTIFAEPDIAPNRIGLDTGAYASGHLTALGLEGSSRWLIRTVSAGDTIATCLRILA